MPKYRVLWEKTEYFDDVIEADNREQAVTAWRNEGHDGEISEIFQIPDGVDPEDMMWI